jgi:5-methylthioadenosine/S-adenosylhomocysteine deaminase
VAGREQVSHVWVAGDLKFHRPIGQGIYHGVEPQELKDIVIRWQSKLSEFNLLM